MKQKIISSFLYNHKLKFNEIEKITQIRSNKLSYYLNILQKQGIIEKQNNYYKLSETAENLIPYISNQKSILPVLLILIKNKNKVFLYKRAKHPFKDKLGLPGGRILVGEDIKIATQRIMKEKFNIKVNLKKVNSISLEQVKNNKKVKYSFLLIFVTATTKDKINCIDINK